MCSAYGSDVLRITTQNGNSPNNAFEEYWLDLARNIWTGPHTFPASLIHASTHPSAAQHPSFVMTPVGITAKLFDSHAFQLSTATFIENGVTLTWLWKTALLPDTEAMAENAMVETTINLALIAGFPATVVALSDQGTVIDQVTIAGSGSPTIWGAFTWGVRAWGGARSAYSPRQVEWSEPIVFRRLQVQVTGNSGTLFTIGPMYLRYQMLGYLLQATGN